MPAAGGTTCRGGVVCPLWKVTPNDRTKIEALSAWRKFDIYWQDSAIQAGIPAGRILGERNRTMASPVAHFSINADDLPRARRFYENVFGWQFQAWGPPGFYMIETGLAPATPLLRGSLQQRREIVAGVPMCGFECTISVADIQGTAAAVVTHGGSIAMPICTLAGIGRLLFFQDPEGNIAGAMQYDTKAE